ncbi:MAG: porin [Pseudomonadota bacterium]
MNQRLLALVIGSVVALPAAPILAEGPTVYGRLDVAQTYVDDDANDDKLWAVDSYSSRLGIKGELETDSDLTIVYQYELEIDPEEETLNSSDDENFLRARDQFVGLQSNFGLLRIGRMETPLKDSQGKVDIFNDHEADFKNYFAGENGENRFGNSVNYTSPEFGPLTAQVAVIQGEDPTGEDNGFADGISTSLAFTQDNIYAAFGVDQEVDGWDLYRLTGIATLGDFGAGALYQMGEESEDSSVEMSGWLINGFYKLENNIFKIQYSQSEEEEDGASVEDVDMIAVGIDHKLSDPTKLYLEYTMVTSDTGTESDRNVLAGGIQHNF